MKKIPRDQGIRRRELLTLDRKASVENGMRIMCRHEEHAREENEQSMGDHRQTVIPGVREERRNQWKI